MCTKGMNCQNINNKTIFISFLSGLLFSIGLMVSTMTNPYNVLAFLDVLGAWNPSLAMVMLGAIGIYYTGMKMVNRLNKPVYAHKFHFTHFKAIDANLIGGSVLFGVGWGISGYCPGPALVSVTSSANVVYFVASVVLGIMLSVKLKAKSITPKLVTNH